MSCRKNTAYCVTTTHMQTGPEECFVKAPDLEQIKSVLEKKVRCGWESP
ncbi:MAG: hypothetical protein V8S14_05715 [Lachnospiraceae bacterium]